MKRQKGVISSGLIVGLVVLVVVILLGVIGFSSYVNAYNYGNQMEQSLKAVKENNRNILAQYGQKVLEVAQVPDMYKKDMVELVQTAIQARYGKNGSVATMQWLKEQNPSLDPEMYKQIQRVIEAGRTDFQNNQTRLVDVRRQYETAIGSFWQGMWLRLAGYPKVNLADFDIVSTDRADDAFKNKKEDGPIKLR